jgi:hypothetical protein
LLGDFVGVGGPLPNRCQYRIGSVCIADGPELTLLGRDRLVDLGARRTWDKRVERGGSEERKHFLWPVQWARTEP